MGNNKIKNDRVKPVMISLKKKILFVSLFVFVILDLIAVLFFTLEGPLAGQAYGAGSGTRDGCTALAGAWFSSTNECVLSVCTTIDSPGKYVFSNEDPDRFALDIQEDPCFLITSDDVSFSCSDPDLPGPGSGTAIEVRNVEVQNTITDGQPGGVVVSGCDIYGFGQGVLLRDSFGVIVRDNSMPVNGDVSLVNDVGVGLGVAIVGGGSNLIQDNSVDIRSVNNLESSGISSFESVANVIRRNNIIGGGVGPIGIYFDSSHKNVLESNTVSGDFRGVYIAQSDDVTLDENNFCTVGTNLACEDSRLILSESNTYTSTDSINCNSLESAPHNECVQQQENGCFSVPNPISFWKGEGNGNDELAVNNAVLRNGVTHVNAGKVGRAFQFNGNNQYLSVENPTESLNIQNSLTIEMWVYPESSDFYQTLVGTPPDAPFSYFVALNYLVPQFFPGGIGGWYAASTPLVIGKWSHLAIIYNGQDVKFYINGELDRVSPLTGNLAPIPVALEIGGRSDAPWDFEGGIDELAIYNQAFTSIQINSIFTADSAGKCDVGLQACIDTDQSNDPFVYGRIINMESSDYCTDDNTLVQSQCATDGTPEELAPFTCPYGCEDGVCSLDTDSDGVVDRDDNCPEVANPDQLDTDNNGIGDACNQQYDIDGDEIEIGYITKRAISICTGGGTTRCYDNCPGVANPDQLDTDGDNIGDACDIDQGNRCISDQLFGTRYNNDGTQSIMSYVNGVWSSVYNVNPADGNSFEEFFPSVDGVLTVGGSGTILSYEETRWETISSLTNEFLRDLFKIYDSRWAVGNNGVIVDLFNARLDPASGTLTTNNLEAIWGSSPSNIWAVGKAGTIIRYDGTSWAVYTKQPFQSTTDLSTLWGSSSRNIWMGDWSGNLFRFDISNGWRIDNAASSLTNEGIADIFGTSAGNIWAVSGNKVLHYDGTSWTIDQRIAQFNPGRLTSVHGSGPNDIWVVGSQNKKLLHFDGFNWEDLSASAPNPGVYSIWASPTQTCTQVSRSGNNDDDNDGIANSQDMCDGFGLVGNVYTVAESSRLAGCIYGDVNANGCVGSSDVNNIAPNIQIRGCPNPNPNRIGDTGGDTNSDSCVDSTDVNRIAPNIDIRGCSE